MKLINIISIFALMLLIAGCTGNSGKTLFSITPQRLVDSENVTILWQVVDDRSLIMNYTLVNNGNIMAEDVMENNSIIRYTTILDPNIEYRRIEIFATDKSGNVGHAFVDVNLSDRKDPVVVRFEIIEN